MIAPPEVEYNIWYQGEFRTQSWKCDSAKHGDCLAGPWNVYIQSAKTYTSLDLSAPDRMMSSLRRISQENGLSFLETPHGATCIRPIVNSIGKTSLVKRPNGDARLVPDSQLRPYSRRTAIVEEYHWPVLDQAYRQPRAREKLLVLGAHHACATSELTGGGPDGSVMENLSAWVFTVADV